MSGKESDNEDCSELFDNWRDCIVRGMKKDRDRRGLKQPHKESILADCIEDED